MGYLALKSFSDGRVGAVMPLTFGRARLVIGPPSMLAYDDGW